MLPNFCSCEHLMGSPFMRPTAQTLYSKQTIKNQTETSKHWGSGYPGNVAWQLLNHLLDFVFTFHICRHYAIEFDVEIIAFHKISSNFDKCSSNFLEFHQIWSNRGTTTITITITEFLVAEACLKIDFLTIPCLYSQGRRKGYPNINVVGKTHVF